jgi:hypothetical protein
MDIGVETVTHFGNALKDAKTIIWNGPMGVFEEPPFDQGTIGIAHAVAEAADRGAIVVVGGGDSVAAVTKAGVADRITHISTGGGATLEFLAGDELPGVAALTTKAEDTKSQRLKCLCALCLCAFSHTHHSYAKTCHRWKLENVQDGRRFCRRRRSFKTVGCQRESL